VRESPPQKRQRQGFTGTACECRDRKHQPIREDHPKIQAACSSKRKCSERADFERKKVVDMRGGTGLRKQQE